MPTARADVGLGLELSDGYLTTPLLTPSDSRPDSRASDLQTPADELVIDGSLTEELNDMEDGAAAAAVPNLITLADEDPQNGADTVEDNKPAESEVDRSMATLLGNALQGDEDASATICEILKLVVGRLPTETTESEQQSTEPERALGKRARSSIDDGGDKQVMSPTNGPPRADSRSDDRAKKARKTCKGTRRALQGRQEGDEGPSSMARAESKPGVFECIGECGGELPIRGQFSGLTPTM